ncbi:MAG TPA: tRNA (adenosine(37)-N6)-threonylcarbamoyltransferase complex dimerization subunit type 1 TsaB [Oceanospirillales bacterium]|nr:tRNA (adenosine(37)-N6)-threonylcarbamoyltransferase complex dimerization subunit type 1 TsaB [Oceanospirillales bacterium]
MKTEMILLAIDTATEACSAALWVDGQLYHRATVQQRLHAELILPFIDELLQQAGIKKTQIQGLIIGQGPGAFTGVRIGVGVAQGLALALDIPVVAVSNLQTLAYLAYRQLNTDQKKRVLVATDARMQEVYWAKYHITGSHIKRIDTEKVGPASKVDLSAIDAYIGSGFHVYAELQQYGQDHPMEYEVNVYSQAKDMLLMVKDNFASLATTIENIEPVYLREP